MITVRCPLCDGTRLSLYVNAPASRETGKHFKVDRCLDCGMIFTNPQPETVIDPSVEWFEEFTPEILAGQQRNAPFILSLISRLTNGRRLFDFGCGNGALVKYALDDGWQAEGQDILRAMVDKGNRYFGFSALSSEPLETYVPPRRGQFDAIVAFQVFEHINRPVETARSLLPLLKSGGIFMIDVPNANQIGEWKRLGSTLHPNSQWNHFTVKTLTELFRRIGCDVAYCSGAPALLGLWRKLRLANPVAMGQLAKRLLPSLGSGVCVIGRKRNTN